MRTTATNFGDVQGKGNTRILKTKHETDFVGITALHITCTSVG